MSQRATLDITIPNRLGLHARAAAKFIQTAQRYTAGLKVRRGEKEVNGKSIMGVMMLAAAQGMEIHLEAEGEDADALLTDLRALIEDRFGEEE